VTKVKRAQSASRLNRLMPTIPGVAWDALQDQAEYLHAKGYLRQLALIE